MSDDAYRWERFASITPVAVFLISIPIGVVSVWIAIAFWFANVPIGILLNRRRPAEFGGPTTQSRR